MTLASGDTGARGIVAALLLPLCTAGQAASLQQELGKCAVIADINARVACYDKLAIPQTQSQLQSPTQAQLQPPEPAPKPAAINPPADKGAQMLVSTVASLKEDPPNRLRITLANGQVWKQAVSKAFFLRAGDTVRITASGWGRAFRLSVDGHTDFIQVSLLE